MRKTYRTIDDVLRSPWGAVRQADEKAAATDRVLRSTSSGGACVNDTVVQLANGRLPFGGVGRSGIGKYHGRFSFELFSNLRAVVRSPRWIDIPLRYAPYRSIRLFKKFLK